MTPAAPPVIAVADTGVLLAAFNGKDVLHPAGVQALNLPKILIVSPLVLAELDHLLHARVGERAALDAVIRLAALAGQGRVQFAAVDRALLAEAQELMRRFYGQQLGLTDCVNAALAWRLTRPALLSFDKHYCTVLAPRRPGEKALEVHPGP
ncbi:type II toxin-antitoxin system VapC family toxin [Kitasatospora kifunensis]|uniref:Ribonuclease VapC n=1 Tax=Kitasatospora kifunensis TaxID=58351 RepID=A0A7W7RAE1_KITKI|nr:PIN domain-containing protein [Kitasatospora kifunensis]MBB4928382.1 putative nucleic acid-binding protein [Kitasatospora kifunensis]